MLVARAHSVACCGHGGMGVSPVPLHIGAPFSSVGPVTLTSATIMRLLAYLFAWPMNSFGVPGGGHAVHLAAARPDLGHLDQSVVGQPVQLAVELALGGRPDVGHRLLETAHQVVTAAGVLGE